MSLQVCSCGWSKVTTYHGLRTHQGMNGCTPKGERIPKSEQPKYNSFVPTITTSPGTSLQVCYCGWSKVTTYQGLRTHQGMNGCTPKGERIPERAACKATIFPPRISNSNRGFGTQDISSAVQKKPQVPATPTSQPRIPVAREAKTPQVTQTFTHASQIGPRSAADAAPFGTTRVPLFGQAPSVSSGTTIFGNQTNTEVNAGMSNQTLFPNPSPVFGAANSFSAPQQSGFTNISTPMGTPSIPVAREAETPQMTQTFTGFLQMVSNSIRGFGTSGAQFSATDSATRISGNQTNPEVNTVATNQTPFETPQKITGTATGARRALDFSTGTQQVQAKRDKIRADLLTQIQKREQKMEQIKTSELECKCSLDAEWREINNVFSDVIKVVEEARRKALEPLEERGEKLEQEARVCVQKLQKEIDELKTGMNELDQNQDLEIPPPMGLDEPQSWINITLDTSFSLASFRATTSKMVERIQTTLEKLSPIELKRIPKFAVDVKLDPTTAHPCLEVSPDGKTVSNVGQAHLVPDCPQRFDLFGSVLGANRLTSGKAYWEVEVRNKSGWDLGVARGDVNRKGNLSVNTNMGYWVIVHFKDKNYAALMVSPEKLKVARKPETVGVFVDYEERLVSFYDVTTKAHIYSFTDCAFSGDIYPYFSPHLKENEKNSAPLVISAVNRQQ